MCDIKNPLDKIYGKLGVAEKKRSMNSKTQEQKLSEMKIWTEKQILIDKQSINELLENFWQSDI